VRGIRLSVKTCDRATDESRLRASGNGSGGRPLDPRALAFLPLGPTPGPETKRVPIAAHRCHGRPPGGPDPCCSKAAAFAHQLRCWIRSEFGKDAGRAGASSARCSARHLRGQRSFRHEPVAPVPISSWCFQGHLATPNRPRFGPIEPAPRAHPDRFGPRGGTDASAAVSTILSGSGTPPAQEHRAARRAAEAGSRDDPRTATRPDRRSSRSTDQGRAQAKTRLSSRLDERAGPCRLRPPGSPPARLRS
jgi:hypothetical protein